MRGGEREGKKGREGADPVTEGNDLEHGYKEVNWYLWICCLC